MIFNWKWTTKDYPEAAPNIQVFGIFVCGGGSTMGYKLAGMTHLGGVELDSSIGNIYKTNHNPKYFYNEDLRDFNRREDLPKALYNLDILDGSPPCSLFSMSGSREKKWGKEKKFREGQKKQTLDDLVFIYMDTIEKLKPKIAILENVMGLISGNGKAYANAIVKKAKDLGYDCQIFILNSAFMEVPQARVRVFFIFRQTALSLSPLTLDFHFKPIPLQAVFTEPGRRINKKTRDYLMWYFHNKKDKKVSDTLQRLGMVGKGLTNYFWRMNRPVSTVLSTGEFYHSEFPCFLSDRSLISVSTFPEDFNFGKCNVQYVVGMCVPPVMMAHIARQIRLQWLSDSNFQTFKNGREEKAGTTPVSD